MPLSTPARADRSSEGGASSISAWAAPRVFGLLLAFRIANALSVDTFFQPDEYFQSLEPAWQLAFARESGAWITWEWKSQLRSSLHPLLFAAVYRLASSLASLLNLNAANRAELLIAAPKICQALFAAAGDYYAWRLVELIHGRNSRAAYSCLALTVFSPWQWFCSTRTLSNSLETSLTAIALYFWPWQSLQTGQLPSALGGRGSQSRKEHTETSQGRHFTGPNNLESDCSRLRYSLLLAATASILRPTNILIWIAVGLTTTIRARTWGTRLLLAREALICGSIVIGISVLADRAYYGTWTVPPVRFLYFNLAQSLAVFYGRNRPDYYITEGLPLLLTTALPFALTGLWHALLPRSVSPTVRNLTKARDDGDHVSETVQQRPESHGGETWCLRLFACIVVFVTLAMSLISHKEVRFLYPLLPILHVLAARPLASFFKPHLTRLRTAILIGVLTINVVIAVYTTQYHQRGVIDVLHHIRHAHESKSGAANRVPISNSTVGFLMPCHSTPWRSHLVHPSIDAWALTCEPPLDVPFDLRPSYMDEADVFYADPVAWLVENMQTSAEEADLFGKPDVEYSKKRRWPEFLIFFEQATGKIASAVRRNDGLTYEECWKGFNTHWHDDWRRQGDVIVWCRTYA